MKRQINLFIGALIAFTACQTTPDPQRIIDAAIVKHGGELYNNVRISFDFRKRHYVLTEKNGTFQYERHFSDSSGQIKDVLTNEGFKRYLNNQDITDTVKKVAAYTRSVNSVAYFAMLPHHLNDDAVIKNYLGAIEIKGQPYHKIGVTFKQEGGGEDYSDQFIYWIHQENQTMDYLGYLYYTDGGGIRFRAPYNERTVGGIRFADYENYQEVNEGTELAAYDQLYEDGDLKLLSKIALENIEVQLP